VIEWKKIGENLVRHPGGQIYLRAKVNGKPVRKSLHTDDLRTAKRKRDAELEKLRHIATLGDEDALALNGEILAEGFEVLDAVCEFLFEGFPQLGALCDELGKEIALVDVAFHGFDFALDHLDLVGLDELGDFALVVVVALGLLGECADLGVLEAGGETFVEGLFPIGECGLHVAHYSALGYQPPAQFEAQILSLK
jgi:hypothetical protein